MDEAVHLVLLFGKRQKIAVFVSCFQDENPANMQIFL